jgi:hypothetical protein
MPAEALNFVRSSLSWPLLAVAAVHARVTATKTRHRASFAAINTPNDSRVKGQIPPCQDFVWLGGHIAADTIHELHELWQAY